MNDQVTFDERSGSAPGRDRFDAVRPGRRVGAHRAVLKTGSRLTRFVLAALATVILTAVGILFVTLRPGSVSFMDQLRDAGGNVSAPILGNRVQAEVSPETTIAVINGTSVDEFAFVVGDLIEEQQLGTILFAEEAADRDVQISAIFYSDPADAGLAKGLGQELGGMSYYESDTYSSYGNQLTVLVGADYRGPGADTLSAQSE